MKSRESGRQADAAAEAVCIRVGHTCRHSVRGSEAHAAHA